MKRHILSAAAAALLAAGIIGVVATAVRSQTPMPPSHRIPPPPRPPMPLPLPDQDGVAVSSVLVEAQVRDGIAETEVTYVFENRTGVPREADFVFPIPAGASLTRFALYDGEKRLDAKLLDKEEATRLYEEIVRRRRDPALLTYVGQSAVRARVFPIAPRSESRVRLVLATVLPREGDARKYVWQIAGPHLPGRPPEKASVRLVVNAAEPLGNLYSPTHDVSVRREGDRRAIVTWESAKEKPLTPENSEFALYIAPATKGSVALSLLTYNAALPQVASLGGGLRESGYFLVLASPVIPDAGKAALPRRVVIVLDRSGSMQGKKLEQARGALRFALERLRPQDSFNLITFSDSIDRFSPNLLPATADNLRRARAYVDDIVADGGTNIDRALQDGLAQFVEASSNNTLLFLTDGLPTVGLTDKDAIVRQAKERNGRKTRVFVFGVGYDVDVPFLDVVARTLRGDADYVRPNEDIEAKVSRFVAKTSAPVLSDLKLTVTGVKTGEIYPKPEEMPDLFAGSQLAIVGRYTGGNEPASLTLTGDANGKTQTYTLKASFPAVETESDFLPRLWATRKIGYLLDDVRLREGDAKREIIQQIVSLSKDFGILTPYTGYFVPEPGTDDRQPVALDTPMRAADALSAPAPSGPAGPAGPMGAARGGAFRLESSLRQNRTGESAVNNSQSARAQRTQNQVGNLYANAYKDGAERDRDEALAQRIRNVATRTFYQVGETWTDAGFDTKKQEIVRVRAYSPAYFELIRRNANLAKWAALGDDVLISANARQAIRFGSEGKETLTEAELKALSGG